MPAMAACCAAVPWLVGRPLAVIGRAMRERSADRCMADVCMMRTLRRARCVVLIRRYGVWTRMCMIG